LIGRYIGKMPFGRLGHRKGDNIKIVLNEVRWGGLS
jgi:hypothetical protein